MLEGVFFLMNQGDFSKFLSFFSFCTFGFFSAVCGTVLTKHFGSLVLAIVSNARKAMTLGLSFLLFPERNVFTSHHLLGSSIFFIGVIIRMVAKSDLKNMKKSDSFDDNRSRRKVSADIWVV
jgi:UAA transporter family